MLMRPAPPAPRAGAPPRPPRRAPRGRAPAPPSAALERVLDDLGDAEERQPPLEERGDGDLVGGVEDARVGAAELPRPPGEREQRERLQVGCRELERQPGGEIELRHVGRRPLRIGERERDRHGHVRIAEVRERGAVAEADERVHDRARVDDDLDPLVRDAEEEVRLDQLEALVRERRRVDRDLRPHAPGRVRERVLDADVGELGARAAAERPARGGQDERVDGSRRRGPSRHWKSAECSESTGSSRPPPRSFAASASSPAATRLSLFASASVTPRSSAHSVAPTPAKPTTAFRTTSGSDALEQLGQVAADLRVRRRRARPRARVEVGRSRRESAELELGVPLDDLDRLPADRAGGAEQRDSLHGHSVPEAPYAKREDDVEARRRRRRAASRSGRACRRGRRAAGPSPSPAGRA